MNNQNWIQRLSEKYNWPDGEPKPERVVEEAKKREIKSADDLIEKMDDAPLDRTPRHIEQSIKEILSEKRTEELLEKKAKKPDSGYERWKWYREYRDSFLGKPPE